MIDEARNKGKKVHFASLMDLRHLKNSELEPQFQKYKVRVVLRGDIVKDDSGSYAVFTEQGSPSFQMTATKVMDMFSRLPGCSRQAAYALSAHTQVKMEDASTLFLNSKVRMPRYLDTSTEAHGQNHGPVWKIQPFLLNGICAVILRQDSCGTSNSRKLLYNTDGEQFSTGNVYLSTEQDDNSNQCMWTISNWQAKQKTQKRLGKFS